MNVYEQFIYIYILDNPNITPKLVRVVKVTVELWRMNASSAAEEGN